MVVSLSFCSPIDTVRRHRQHRGAKDLIVFASVKKETVGNVKNLGSTYRYEE